MSFSFGLIRAVAAEIDAGKLDPQKQLDNQVNGYIYDSNRTSPRVLAVLRGSEARTLITYEQIADPMRHAIVAIEDRRFWEHDGIDLRGIGRALLADIRHKSVVEGGSTITQQFVKNALDRDQKTIARKVREAAYAWQLERDDGGWPKKKILQEYLNTIYFGNGAYGVQQAALTYFQKGAKDLDLAESALLAGIPADPNRYDPVANPKAAQARRRLVLQAMLDESKITPTQLEQANKTPLPDPDDVRLPGTEGPAQHFVNYVKQQLIDKYGQTEVFGGGIKVRTTIDLELQQHGARRDLEVADRPRRPVGGARRDRPARRGGARDGRRQQLPQEPVQPRRPGRPPARLVLQAVRARDGAAAGDLTRDALRVGAAVDRPRRQVLGRRQLRRRLLRQHRPREGDDRVGQLRLRAADPARRREEGGRDREAARDPEQARRLLRDRPRRRGGDAARAGARVRDPRPWRPPRGRQRSSGTGRA